MINDTFVKNLDFCELLSTKTFTSFFSICKINKLAKLKQECTFQLHLFQSLQKKLCKVKLLLFIQNHSHTVFASTSTLPKYVNNERVLQCKTFLRSQQNIGSLLKMSMLLSKKVFFPCVPGIFDRLVVLLLFFFQFQIYPKHANLQYCKI